MLLTDLASECFEESITIGEYDELTARIEKRVLSQVARERRKPFRLKKSLRILLVAAVLVSLFTVTAYALGVFQVQIRQPEEDEVIHGVWIERDEAGEVTYVQNMDYPDAGLVLTYETETIPFRAEFKPNWLPCEPNHEYGADDWYWYFQNDGPDPNSTEYPYLIQVAYALPDYQLVMQTEGGSEIVAEESWGELQVTKVVNQEHHFGAVNYVLLFSPADGYLVVVGGTEGMEVITRIAENLEIRVTEEKAHYDPDYAIGCINIGRG